MGSFLWRRTLFTDHITKASNTHYCLSRKEVTELAYEFANETSKNYPKSWDMNGCADEQWFIDFIKCNNKVFLLQKPQATSLARAMVFNRTVVVFPQIHCSVEA
jgi:hypothetical protein